MAGRGTIYEDEGEGDGDVDPGEFDVVRWEVRVFHDELGHDAAEGNFQA